MKLRHHHS